jgi:hypothetical protein
MAEDTGYWQLLEPHWSKLGNYRTAADWAAIVKLYPRPIILLYATHFCQSEVRNGGLLQFFQNSTGVMAPEAVEGYDEIKMPLLAETLQIAMSMLGEGYPRDRSEREFALLVASSRTQEELKLIRAQSGHVATALRQARQPKAFDSLDEQFWKLADKEKGGFEAAADVYASSIEQDLVFPSPERTESSGSNI